MLLEGFEQRVTWSSEFYKNPLSVVWKIDCSGIGQDRSSEEALVAIQGRGDGALDQFGHSRDIRSSEILG